MGVVLIVDDDARLRRRLQSILTGAGLDIVKAENGLEALDAVREQEFDLVFLDVLMPRLNGLETLRILHRSHPHLKVCMLTVLGNQDLIARAAGYGVVSVLTKPIDPEHVLQVVEEWCRQPARHSH